MLVLSVQQPQANKQPGSAASAQNECARSTLTMQFK